MKSRGVLVRSKRFQLEESQQIVSEIESMLAEFGSMVLELNQQIDDEEKRTGISDVNHYAYPSLAKAAVKRRDNLLVTIEGLKDKLTRAGEELIFLSEDLKRAESIDSRHQTNNRHF